MLNEIEKTNLLNKQDLRYLNISNIFFDHKLTNIEIASLKEILFNINNVSQIYFKGTIDLNSIQIVKYLLEMSPMVNDSHIEKYILLDNIKFKDILDTTFENPDTWQISYKKFGNRYKMTSISKYKSMELYFNNLIDKITSSSKTQLEKVALAYNYTKLLDYDSKDMQLPEITNNLKANSLGFNIFFKELLDKLNIKSYIGETTNDTDKNYVTIVDINDSKYDIDGIYLFDPLSDSIPKDTYENNDIRSINYNYFGLNLEEYEHTIFNDKLVNVLSCLIHDIEYDKEKINIIDRKTKKELNESFDSDFNKIHKKVKETKKLTEENKFKLIENISDFKSWDKLGINHENLIKEN